ncbi:MULTISPECIES: type II toxin-antitoxin system ParD family antitoxin [Vibrio]|uniref:type II toxin-antitoxin system ParD family antitoxin n=1 Tax=Vibrio cincinnatiensis TaxID=675 RepID=UPI001C308D5A|nr:type II toxin-antitoxin system ParD family antitoxin [Vibrio metschnikovii]EKO3587261.1 type II toxin-antitoxin system ParD family antitoxin [Vibrio metschnikovii]EKO3733189.1 type II toxin-antitoxin system ParD family antitoxin [Vibrio metschnikovii]MCG3734434.1 type II toxin-antitoxin system ParD family antitoxin [Vibrio cincinnatiensis]MCG3741559.1 type II toxin-antitoxin system ParD family antitoxin [Vibrio cincinnatiensis]
MSVTIGSQLDDEFISQLIATGRYGSTSEVRLLERQEKQTTALKMAIEAGEQSGQCSLSLHDIAAKVKQKHNV